MEELFAGGAIPELVYIGWIERPAREGYQSLYHHHPDFIELLLITRGSAEVRIGSELYQAVAPALVMFNEGEWHEERTNPELPHTMLFLAVKGLRLHGLERGRFHSPGMSPIVLLRENLFSMERQFRELHAEFHAPEGRDPWVIRYKLAALLAEWNRASVKRPPPRVNRASESVMVVQAYIHEHYSEPLTLERLAAVGLLSPYYLSRLFKEATGMAPIQYAIAYRMKAACQYLATTERTTEEIALLVGYESLTHFQQAFKKATGTTPGRYRKQER
ncbi:AraC family transcriptional regulator [Paenibacillus sacheonensis]|uniref:Helix-turn-helix domain-containing protein n=1 Tax=Paenibacillus sacheonensis TaxID=742054 RepID=A0A7X5C1C3_9BACL|nr:helix-turn-helix domain-containing protein [Paenibacillus sacheonensis]MBM7565107.1 AraC-like DNA-binding protein [Paenibacillus sacheonensis]NBC70110.1 helix-turn-helix domain-containing protein [Paenibacillus sacheonensis]